MKFSYELTKTQQQKLTNFKFTNNSTTKLSYLFNNYSTKFSYLFRIIQQQTSIIY